jgi:hypothetical protein
MNNKELKVFEYAKKHNTSIQNVYRWVRERKIPEDKIIRKQIIKEVIFIKD